MNSAKPFTRVALFDAVHIALSTEPVDADVAALVKQTGHTEGRVREVLATLSILADAQVAANVTGASLAQALTARRQAIDAIGGAA